MANEMVSVILPTYNRADQLRASIESVLNQTYPYLELIIVDDGSTDATEAVVSAIGDARIRYFKLAQNGGQSKARNYGIEKARYEYIAFEDSDDIWNPKKLEIQMGYMLQASTEVGFVYHKTRCNWDNLYHAILPAESIPLEKKSGDIFEQLLYDNLVDCPTILAKKECILQAGCFDTEMNALEDYDLALKMARNWKALFIDEILLESIYLTDGVSASVVKFLMASCYMVKKYKKDYVATDTLNHRLEIILQYAEEMGMKEQFVRLLELNLQE